MRTWAAQSQAQREHSLEATCLRYFRGTRTAPFPLPLRGTSRFLGDGALWRRHDPSQPFRDPRTATRAFLGSSGPVDGHQPPRTRLSPQSMEVSWELDSAHSARMTVQVISSQAQARVLGQDSSHLSIRHRATYWMLVTGIDMSSLLSWGHLAEMDVAIRYIPKLRL